jgi:hypothetical protein
MVVGSRAAYDAQQRSPARREGIAQVFTTPGDAAGFRHGDGYVLDNRIRGIVFLKPN